MRRLREIPCRLLARTAVQPRVLVALMHVQCGTMATVVSEVATESEEDVRFRYSGKKADAVCGFFGVFLYGFAVFGPLLRPSLERLSIL